MSGYEEIGKDNRMMYKTDVTLLPDDVRHCLEKLQMALAAETDYLHVQVTYDYLQTDRCEPTMHVVVER